MFGNNLLPGVIVAEAYDCIAQVFQAFRLRGISPLMCGVLVMRAINVDSRVTRVIEKIWPRVARLDVDLGVRRQAQSVAIEVSEPTAFQIGMTLPLQPGQVFGPGVCRWRRVHAALTELEEELTERLPVQEPMVGLVGITHQAVVAGGLTIFTGIRGAPLVFT